MAFMNFYVKNQNYFLCHQTKKNLQNLNVSNGEKKTANHHICSFVQAAIEIIIMKKKNKQLY